MKAIEIYTDGACSGNPGPGGWGAILRYAGHQKEISGAEPNTTNNRMELTALIKALELLKEPCKVNVYTDSRYLCDSMSKGWAISWKNKGWKKSDGKPAINSDLWSRLLYLSEIHNINLTWIKGHAGHPENELCDTLATNAIKNLTTLNKNHNF